MKRLASFFLAMVMALGLAAFAPAPAAAAGEGKSIKVLAIGNSYAQDACLHLYRVLKAEGYGDVTVGYLYYGGCSLDQHMDFVKNGSKEYRYYKNNSDFWKYTDNVTMLTAIKDEPWDCITLQQNPPRSGTPEAYPAALDYLIPYVQQNKTNPEAKLGWHMTWTYSHLAAGGNSDYFGPLYNDNYDYQYKCIVDATKSQIMTRKEFSFIVPAGTAIQNARTSFIGDDLHIEDGVHLNDKGKLAAAYVWYCTLAGKTSIDGMKFTAVNGKKLTKGEISALTEAVNNTMKEPYACTPSAITTAPPLEADETYTVQHSTATMADVPKIAPGSGLHVGFGRADITPSRPAPLAGYGSTRQRMGSETLEPEDRLNATAIAVSDGINTNLIFTEETIRTPSAWAHKAGEAIQKATGVPADHVTISAVHTHSGPDIGDEESKDQPAKELVSENPAGTQETWYFEEWKAALVEAAISALADLAPVQETKINFVTVDDMSWIRHWRLSDGTMGGVNVTSVSGASYKGHPRDCDRTMQLIRFVRSGRKDVVLVNFQVHGTVASTSGTDFGTAGRPYISADYSGYMRRYMEEQAGDILVAYFLGACGNINPTTQMKSVREKAQPPREPGNYGRKLGDYALAGLKDMVTVKADKVQSLRQQHIAFDDGYEGSTRTMEQDVITLGGVIAFASAGYEMFDVNGMDIKTASPFRMTFILTNTQGHEYMPSWETHRYDVINGEGVQVAYEVRNAQCNVVAGTAEDLANGLVAMLNKLYKNL